MRIHFLACFCLSMGLCHAGTGVLELASQPGGAEVFVDGKKKGSTSETPGQMLKMELDEGDHVVLAKLEGMGSATKKIFIGDKVTQPLTLTLVPDVFVNQLGMKFLPVPDTRILMCIHETRNQDFAKFAEENPEVGSRWKHPKLEMLGTRVTIEDDSQHPVVNVSWEDSNAFCAWLTRKEGRTYRLPTDFEWSCAAGIAHLEKTTDTPEAKDRKVVGFTWGDAWPPPAKAGNFWDLSAGKVFHSSQQGIKDYEDGFPATAPVMSFTPNKLGIYDLSGNVWEWCGGLYMDRSESDRFLRGGSWQCDDPEILSACRRIYRYAIRDHLGNIDDGFRCVIEQEKK